MPTAVITESSENTASSTTICRITCQNTACCTFWPLSWPLLPSTRSCSSMVPLNNRNRPPRIRIRSRPEISAPSTVNSGAVRVTTQAMLASRPSRISMASVRPIMRARLRCAGGSLSARMAMNTRLSIPSTISRMTSVARPSQAVGSDIQSKIINVPQEGSGSSARGRPAKAAPSQGTDSDRIDQARGSGWDARAVSDGSAAARARLCEAWALPRDRVEPTGNGRMPEVGREGKPGAAT
ncbi:Uncharacterised protein [Achromobacter sp. 2789STDY5608615]|nr:Uncharacterised protein [Achromobacter sp. 2789STDY5608615]